MKDTILGPICDGYGVNGWGSCVCHIDMVFSIKCMYDMYYKREKSERYCQTDPG